MAAYRDGMAMLPAPAETRVLTTAFGRVTVYRFGPLATAQTAPLTGPQDQAAWLDEAIEQIAARVNRFLAQL